MKKKTTWQIITLLVPLMYMCAGIGIALDFSLLYILGFGFGLFYQYQSVRLHKEMGNK